MFWDDEDDDVLLREVPDEDDSSTSNHDDPDDTEQDREEDVIPEVPVPVISGPQFDPQNPKMGADTFNLFASWEEEKKLRDIKRQENLEKAIPILENVLLAVILDKLFEIYMNQYHKTKGFQLSFYREDLSICYHSKTNMIYFHGIEFDLTTDFKKEQIESYLKDQNLKVDFVEQLSQLELTYKNEHVFDFKEQMTRINKTIISLGFCVKKELISSFETEIKYGFPESS
jgi:hypothetical protein